MLLKLNKLLIVHSFVIFISSNGYFFHPKESESDALKRITSGLENLTEPERKLEIQKRAEAHANSYNKYLESNPINERTQSLPRVKNFKRQTENAMHKMFEDESKWKGKESRIFENGSRIDEDGNSIPEQMYLDLKEKVKALRAKGNLKEIERINKAPKQYYTELNSKRSKNANIFSKKEETKDKSGDEELKNVVKTTTEDNNQKITKDGNEQQLASTLGQTETQTTANTTGDSSVQQNNENNKGEKTERGGGNIKRPRTKRLVKGTPKGRRIIKNPDYKKAIRHEVIDAYDIVLQAFIGGAKVHSDVIKKLYRNSKGEVRQRIQFLDNKNGFKTFDDFVHSLWENQPNIEQFTIQDFTKALEDVINSYTGTRAMVDDLNSRYKTDEELLEEEMQKAQEYEEYLRTTEENERYSQSDYDNGIDYWETLTDEDIAEMERAKDAILQMQIDDYFRELEQQSKEQESTPKFSADDKKDAKKQEQQATANGILDYLKKKIPFISFVTDAKEYAEKRDEATKDLTNKSGDILGFVHNGKIYLDPAKLTPKTLAEEFTHLQQQALRLASKQGNKQAQKIVGAWDNATSKLADALISGNAKAKELLKELGIPESELASDVYKQQAGESKTAYKERLQDEIWAKAQKTEFAEHLERLSKENKFTATVNKMIDALKDFAKYVGQQLGIYNEKEWSKLSLPELIDRTNKAISGDKFLKGLGQGVSKGTPQFQKSQEQHKEISQKNFETLIEKLKKPFANAFKNLNITTDLNDFNTKAEKQGIKPIEFTNKKGEVYGAKLPDGTIYINPEKLNANTPIHEFSHLWEQLMPNAWKKGLELFKQTKTGKDLFEKLQKDGNYKNLSEEQLWSEAMNMLIGNLGESKYHSLPKGKLAEFVDWVKDTMAKFVNVVTGKKELNKEYDLKDFTNKVLGDLLGDKLLTPESVKAIDTTIQYAKDYGRKSDFNADGTVKESVRKEIEEERKTIVEKAKADGTYMKAPNGEKTKLNEEQWVTTRTERFKDWFGDWEIGNKLDLIENNKPTSINPNNYSVKQIEEIYQSLDNGVNIYDNKNVRFVNSTLGKLLRHKGFDTKQIIPQLKQIFDNAVPILSETEQAKEGHKQHTNFKGYHHYLGKIKVDGREMYIRFTVQELNAKAKTLKDGFIPNELHSTFVSDIEIYNANPAVISGKSPATNTSDGVTDTKLQQFFEKAKEAKKNSSQVIDPETGEPLVVYHGTNAKFTEFRNDIDGIYLTNSKTEAQSYAEQRGGDILISSFLNMRKPNIVDESIVDISTKGYDGIIDKGDSSGIDYYNAFSPNQIKSATSNVGTFSNENNDIRFQIDNNLVDYIKNEIEGDSTLEETIQFLEENDYDFNEQDLIDIWKDYEQKQKTAPNRQFYKMS